MTTSLSRRKGTLNQHDAFTGVNGEITVVTDSTGKAQSLRLHDAVTVGGLPIGSFTGYESFADIVASNQTADAVLLKSYYAGQSKGGGIFIRTTETGTPNTNNGGSWFIDPTGAKWALLHNGTVSIHQFGFVADYDEVTKTGTDNGVKLIAISEDDSIRALIGDAGKYYMGVIANQTSGSTTSKAVFNRPMDIDWQGACLFSRLANEDSAGIAQVLVEFLDSYSSFRNCEFTHIDWDRTKASVGNRGIWAVGVGSRTTSTKNIHGFEFENILVHRGQGMVSIAAGKSSAGYNYSASGITLKGYIHGVEVYKGISLFYSGDKIKGKFTVDNFIRALITYDVSDIDLEFETYGDNQATSGSMVIYTTGDRPSRNIKIKGRFAEINGPVSPTAHHESGDLAEMDNWDIDVYIDKLGSNMSSINSVPFRLGAVSIVTGVYQETGTYTVKQNCKFRVRTGRDVVVNDYFYLQTTSPNIKPVYVDARNFDVSSIKNQGMLWCTPNGLQIGHRGNIQTTPLTFSLRDALDKKIAPGGLFSDGSALFSISSSVADNVFKKFWLRGSLTSTELEVVQVYNEYESYVVGTYNPTITMTTDPFGSEFVTVQASAGGNADGRHVFTFSQLTGSSITV